MIQGKIDISKLVFMIAYYESLINYINAFIESTSAIGKQIQLLIE